LKASFANLHLRGIGQPLLLYEILQMFFGKFFDALVMPKGSFYKGEQKQSPTHKSSGKD